MNNKYFKNGFEWSKENTNTKGLPRPYAYTDPSKNNEKVKNIKIAKKVPIPWQSKSDFHNNNLLKLNLENENLIYNNQLCPYCGIPINDNEIVVKWKCPYLDLLQEDGAYVFSDVHPFHTECMSQARIFCPFISTLKDEDFEVDIFFKLKEKAYRDIAKAKKEY